MAVRRIVETATTNGIVRVNAYAASHSSIFVVHERQNPKFEDKTPWVVTHVPTGHLVPGVSKRTRGAALNVAVLLEDACPAAREVKRDPEDNSTVIGPLAEFAKQAKAALAAVTP